MRKIGELIQMIYRISIYFLFSSSLLTHFFFSSTNFNSTTEFTSVVQVIATRFAGEKKSYFRDLCSGSSRFAVLMRIKNIKLKFKIKRMKQVIVANRQEAASVSVYERAQRWRYVRGSARQTLLFKVYIYEKESQQFLLEPLLRKLS